MARTSDEILRIQIGLLVIQIAQLQAQIEAQAEELAKLKAVTTGSVG